MNKDKQHHLIYKTTCVITGKWYIGMHSTDVEDDGYLGSGIHLQRSIKKHGKSNHLKQVLERFDTRQELEAREKVLIDDSVVLDKKSMNLKRGGQGLTSAEAFQNWASEEYRSKQSQATKNRWARPEERIKHSESGKKAWETRDKIAASNVAKIAMADPGTRARIAESVRLARASKPYPKKCWVFKDGKSDQVNLSDLNTYLEQGFTRGRK